MFRNFARFVSVALLLSLLAACGGGTTGQTGATSAATGATAAGEAATGAEAPAATTEAAGAATTEVSTAAETMPAGETATAEGETATTGAETTTSMAEMTATAGETMTAGETATAIGATSETATSTNVVAAAALPAAKPDANVTAQLKGSGSSFVAKIMQRWVEDYKQVVPGVTINYQSVGSGQGINDYTNGVTDFGATDAFLSDEQLTKAPDTLHIPVVAGAVVATYNLPGVDNLQFSPETLADIFLGKINKWNDPKIAADNPGVTLPDTGISVVYRADGSGTTSIFTTYLSSVSPEWKEKVGAGTTVKWPVGQGAPKNDGVAAGVKNTQGGIGYVELIYALGNKLPAPAIKNAAGQFVKPTLESVTETANGFLANLPADLRLDIVNPPQGQNAYPISGFTWLLLHKEMKDQAKAKALTDFVYWTLANGDEQAKGLGYSPLPPQIKAKTVEKLEQVTVNGQPVFKRP